MFLPSFSLSLSLSLSLLVTNPEPVHGPGWNDGNAEWGEECLIRRRGGGEGSGFFYVFGFVEEGGGQDVRGVLFRWMYDVSGPSSTTESNDATDMFNGLLFLGDENVRRDSRAFWKCIEKTRFREGEKKKKGNKKEFTERERKML